MTKDRVNLENNIELYLKDLKDIAVLSKKEERLLISQYQLHNNIKAKHKIILHNTRLVINIAKKYKEKNPKKELLDLIQQGTEGLFIALDKFNLSTPYKFSTYATCWIEQKIIKYIKSNNIIRIPESIQDAANKYKKELTRIEREEYRIPTSKEIGNNIGLSEGMLKKVEQVIYAPKEPVSLEQKTESPNDESTTILNYTADNTIESTDSYINDMYKKRIIKQSYKFLSNKEQDVVNLVHGIGYDNSRSCEEVGRILSITRERVRQLLKKAHTKIRNEIQKQNNSKPIEYKNIENYLLK